MSVPSQWTCLRLFVFSNLLMLGFLMLFYSYHHSDMTDMKLPSFVTFLHPRWNNSNINLEYEIKKDTILLIWTWPFGNKFDTDCSVYGISKCHLTDNRNMYLAADGVFFHHLDVRDLPIIPRPSFQKWVWFNMESPANTAVNPKLNHIFNLTCNYRTDSTIQVPYGYVVPRSSYDPIFKLPTKDKLVCWIVSNWKSHFQRIQYYNKLKNYIDINTYGQAFGSLLSDQAYTDIISGCKFYLAFENSVAKDYMTEKVFSPLLFGSVPIVLGPPRENYQEQIPEKAFIHVNDFASPKELAQRLHYLDNHPEEYMDYFKWTREYKVILSYFGKEHACRSCNHIQTHKGPEVVQNLQTWFWGEK
ncbi:4-galactosyl-N-acetylglucosaminide 3-alpha-L-fucosyltransferase 9-like [Boleophthalmus pectinirostris]|uniref:4-galactosyl-N-acetylglucosaminide 3-alpha-L-fucosyltransferase 9-like n=1 Tax=Boleophthalmus pectinirostris TaxID=150288 RepID=UPI000A1C4075|nr:4-galactosyl-N-acetylglucosaminide 3-alpha-L-fucosyltransferase 9-like [Boleophthalmus pectinirostris]XP_055007147.1 4-galactosyl-N-acetylglucosaminide 3-alpha-L-fucosyltransferase 9-like [Boleophthalmus pectinirostris]